MKKDVYLCIVRTKVPDYPVSCRVGVRPYRPCPKLKRWRLTTASIFLFHEFYPELPNEISLENEAFLAILGTLPTHHAKWLQNRPCTMDQPHRLDERCNPSKG